MNANGPNYKESIIYHWIENLVGTHTRFSINVLITALGGTIYSFQMLTSSYLLAIFGVLSPLLFTLCLYFLIQHLSGLKDNPFPNILTSQSTNGVVMAFDMAIVIILAVLIHADIINYLFFRLLQTTIFPLLLILMLRYLHLLIKENEEDNI
jgi:hypothetical protein